MSMSLPEIHKNLSSDLAYQYSIEHNDVHNMMMVLRAHNLPFTFEDATNILKYEIELQESK